MNLLRVICLLGSCLAPLCAQQALRVEGSVVDEAGQPIAGAEISILVHRAEMDAALVERVLSEQPLPKARSDADGNYSLVFDALHLFMTGERPALGLRIAKEGYQSWVEQLPAPLDNYLGSDAVLPRLTEEDYAEVIVAEPVPGMLLYLRRVGAWETYGHFGFFPWEQRVIAVPSDGRVRIGLPLLPNPLPHGLSGGTPLRLDFEISLWSPGRSAGPKRLLGGDRVEFSTVDITAVAGPVGARTLYRCDDGQLRWFPGLFAVQDRLLEPIAHWAPGYAVADPGEDLMAVPERGPEITLQIQNEAGEGLGSARVRLFPLTALPADGDPQHISWSRESSRILSVDDSGEVILHPQDLAEPGFVLVEAKGYAARIERLDLVRTRLWQLKLASVRTGSFRLHITDAGGEPVAGAMLIAHWIPDPAEDGLTLAAMAPPAGMSFLSDADGLIDWNDVPAGQISYMVFATGHPVFQGSIFKKIAANTVLEESVQMKESYEIAIQVRLTNGRHVPFAPIEEMFFTNGKDEMGGSSASLFYADGRGRVRMFRDVDEPIGVFRGAASRRDTNQLFKYHVGRRLVIEVAEQRPTAFLAGEPMEITAWADLPPAGWFDARSLLDWRGETSAILFDSVAPRVLTTRDDPPIVFDPLEEEAREPRYWSIDFGGEVPADLSKVTARALSIEDTVFFKPLDGNLVAPGPPGILELSTWDDRAYLCLFMHPDYLPTSLQVDAGPAGKPLEVAFERGVRVRLRYELSANFRKWPWCVTISGADIALSTAVSQRQIYPLGAYALERGVHELELPFALPKNQDVEIGIGRNYGQAEISARISTGEGPSIEVDLGMIKVR